LPENQLLHGYLLCKVRSVVFTFSENFNSGSINIWKPKSDINKDSDETQILIKESQKLDLFVGTFLGTKQNLPNGIYFLNLFYNQEPSGLKQISNLI